MNKKLLKISLVGTVVSALCCFTPLLVWVLGALGLSAAALWLDSVLIPSLAFFVGLSIYALVTKHTGEKRTS